MPFIIGIRHQRPYLPEKVRHEHSGNKEYLELCLQRESAIIPRKEMLAKKPSALRIAIKELEKSVAYIDRKQNFYDEALSGKRPYVSNPIRDKE